MFTDNTIFVLIDDRNYHDKEEKSSTLELISNDQGFALLNNRKKLAVVA